MYTLPHFKEPDEQVVIDFVKKHPFAMLIGVDAEHQPVATQVPVFIDERDGQLFLTGHIQRKTDHHKAFEQNPHVLAVFTGAHAYISASWYENKEVASTWNYMSVHAKGVLRFLSNAELYEVLKRTTHHFENNPHSPSLVEKMSDEYVQSNLKAIVAFEVEVKELNHVFKLSQNHSKKNYDQIIHQLQQQGGEAKEVADIMEARKHKVFNK
ncbi:FMN-binding negative transcriptional regulator [Lacibacter sp. MH-610]|uniref:FMN-binding negative transcriptional regulator n=1 Tax=Lacibacter sp. MH-610 TaxID=3020883 RepID=UPI0038926EA3